jgi:hypothetical protein
VECGAAGAGGAVAGFPGVEAAALDFVVLVFARDEEELAVAGWTLVGIAAAVAAAATEFGADLLELAEGATVAVAGALALLGGDKEESLDWASGAAALEATGCPFGREDPARAAVAARAALARVG